jgi:hypothetical protein
MLTTKSIRLVNDIRLVNMATINKVFWNVDDLNAGV